jgi:aminoglycoside 6-adenylyltransferase
MDFKNQENQILEKLIHWAEYQDSVRAMLLTSSRANPNASVDVFSDYDIVLIVQDIHPFFVDRSWLADFGDVLVAYWDPIQPAPDFGIEQVGNVIQYEGGLHIDFTLWPIELLQEIIRTNTMPTTLDDGYMVLIDKDNLTVELPSPTYTAYIPKRPTEDAYLKVIEDFFSDVPYIAKCLRRDELLPAKWCLDFDMRYNFLLRMLEWRMELDFDWSKPTGVLGRGLKRKLPPHIWTKYTNTYAGAEINANWEALFSMMSLFRDVGVEVAKGLGYVYPYDLDQKVTTFVREMINAANEKGRKK